jgi:hypothetical protein
LHYPEMRMLLLKYGTSFNFIWSLLFSCSNKSSKSQKRMPLSFIILRKWIWFLNFRFLSLSVNIQSFFQRYWRIVLQWSQHSVFKNFFLSHAFSISSPITLLSFLEKYSFTSQTKTFSLICLIFFNVQTD